MKKLPYILIVLLAIALCISESRSRKVEFKEILKTDTIFETKFNTIFEERPVEVSKTIIDTFYIVVNGNSMKLPREQKHFSKDNLYDAWVSGYNPELDSLKVYNRTEYETIYKETVRTVPEQKYSVYVNGGFKRFRESFAPEIGISITSPRNFSCGANLGLYKGSVFYGVSVGYKIK